MTATSSHTDVKILQLKKGFYTIRLIAPEGEGASCKIRSKNKDRSAGYEVLGERKRGCVSLDETTPLAVVFVSKSSAIVPIEINHGQVATAAKITIDVEMITFKQGRSECRETTLWKHSEVTLSGHVEVIGDVEKGPGEWLGAQSGKARIEGFALHWSNKPPALDLVYGCNVEGLGRSPNSLTGGYVGTRKHAAPIKAFWIDLKGDASGDYDLAYFAYFSRSGLLRGKPSKVTSGLGVDDHLTGLIVNIQKKSLA